MNNSTNPFDHDSLMYKLMKYLYKIQEQMQMVPYVWILIDVVQFSTIITSLLGQVIKVHYNIMEEELFNNFLNIFFNYSKIYNWLVISGACSAFIVILALIIYIIIEFRKEIQQITKNTILCYCALTGTISIGLFEFFSQVMANNLINIVSRIFNKKLQMGVELIGLFFLNVLMMLFVSIFNSDRRIFRLSLIVVSLSLNMLPFTITCILLIGLSVYYQFLDKIVYKKLFYLMIIATSLWCILEVNDIQEYELTSREVYLGMAVVAILLYYLHYDHNFLDVKCIEENEYLVALYKKRLKKQDKKEDYLLADQYFTKYFSKQREDRNRSFIKETDVEFYLTSTVQDWHQTDFKSRIIEKIKSQKLQTASLLSIKDEISYFYLLLELKINMVELLEEVFQFMSEKKNENIKVIYQINKLTHQIQKEFLKSKNFDQNVLRLEEIIYIEELYKKFYLHYLSIVDLLEAIFDNLDAKNGEITEITEEKMSRFTLEQKILEKTLSEINSITGPKLESKLYEILTQVWGKYQKGNQFGNSSSTSDQQIKLSHEQSKQKFNFSYVVISNKIIKYASMKFLSTYSYKQSYIVGQNMALIFPSKFSLLVLQLLQKNADKKIFHSNIPIINQRGLFEMVNATFYLIPQFKGEITYIIQFKKISEYETKNLFLFNTQTLCIETFNKTMIKKFNFSIQKIHAFLESGAIQFSNLFVFNNQEKDFLTFTQKKQTGMARTNRKPADHQSIAIVGDNNSRYIGANNSTLNNINKESDKATTMKALMKMDYLSNMKRMVAKNVTLESEISFDINNITYKVIKVDDATSSKQSEGSVLNERTDEVNFLKEINRNKQSQFQNSTKDLKKKYENEEFFCPISNPYLPRILEKMNHMSSKNRVNNVLLVKIVYYVSLTIFFIGMFSFKMSTANLGDLIGTFEKQAQCLNKQYSYFMSGVLHIYKIHHMDKYPTEFTSYIQSSRNLSLAQAEQFYQSQKQFLMDEKALIIKKFQIAYFDYPILYDTETVPVQIYTDFFELKSTSKTSQIYDIVVFLMDGRSQIIKIVISQNFHLYDTLIRILRPDGRYNEKINSIDNEPSIIILTTGIITTLTFGLIYFWLYQLREAREDIIAMYKYIEKKELNEYKRKIEDIQDLIEILSNNKKVSSQEPQQKEEKTSSAKFNTVSELNSANNLSSQDQLAALDSVNTLDRQEAKNDKPEGENENQELLSMEIKQQPKHHRKSLRKHVKVVSKSSILVQTLLKYPVYIIFIFANWVLLFYAYFQATQYANNFIEAFSYFQKVRAANFQFRYLYVTSQSYAFYTSNLGLPLNDSILQGPSIKNTHFDYEKPKQFSFNSEENMCSEQNFKNIQDPLFSQYVCTEVDGGILSQEFSEAYEKYEQNLRIISDKTYQELITDDQLRKIYFNTMYEFFIFESYLDKLTDGNFSLNISLMGDDVKTLLLYVFLGSVLWVIFTFAFVFIVTFPKLETELATIISLIKMIPPQTMFSMKVAALFKKRKILQKLNCL